MTGKVALTDDLILHGIAILFSLITFATAAGSGFQKAEDFGAEDEVSALVGLLALGVICFVFLTGWVVAFNVMNVPKIHPGFALLFDGAIFLMLLITASVAAGADVNGDGWCGSKYYKKALDSYGFKCDVMRTSIAFGFLTAFTALAAALLTGYKMYKASLSAAAGAQTQGAGVATPVYTPEGGEQGYHYMEAGVPVGGQPPVPLPPQEQVQQYNAAPPLHVQQQAPQPQQQEQAPARNCANCGAGPVMPGVVYCNQCGAKQ